MKSLGRGRPHWLSVAVSAACVICASSSALLADPPAQKTFLCFGYSPRILADVNTNDATAALKVWAEAIGARRGLDMDMESRLFLEIVMSSTPSRAVLPVFFGQADVALVTRSAFETMIELNPQVGAQLKVLANSGPLLPLLLAPTRHADPDVMGKVMKAILELQEEPGGDQILMMFKTDKLVRCEASWLESFQALVKEHQALSGKPTHVAVAGQ